MVFNNSFLYEIDRNKLELWEKQVMKLAAMAYYSGNTEELIKFVNPTTQNIKDYDKREIYIRMWEEIDLGFSNRKEKIITYLDQSENINNINITEDSINFNYLDTKIKVSQLFKRFKYLNNNSLIKQMINYVIKNKNSKIVIGYIMGHTNKTKELYFWIEKQDYVIDYLKNMIFNKEGFYELTSAKIINSIDSKDLKNQKDYYEFTKNILDLDDKTYLVFNKELKLELENKHLI